MTSSQYLQKTFYDLACIDPSIQPQSLTAQYKQLLTNFATAQRNAFNSSIQIEKNNKLDLQSNRNQVNKSHLLSIDSDPYTFVETLIKERSLLIDQVLKQLWHYHGLDKVEHLALIAVGGYGRQELHPLSDIDLLIISLNELTEAENIQASQLISQLWDLRLEIGHSVRTIEQCIKLAKEDITVITNIQESRFLLGNESLYKKLYQAISSHELWSTQAFYEAKVEEQSKRYQLYHNTTYNLEPDIKLNPGGLRDIHTLIWIAHRLFNTQTLDEMRTSSILTETEYKELIYCLHFLWHIRFALHLSIKRYDNRLLFSHQITVSELLGYEGKQPHEQMMKDFYRVLARVNELNHMLLQLMEQDLFESNYLSEKEQSLNDHFSLKGNKIDSKTPDLFLSQPERIIELFYLIAITPEVCEITVSTLRQLNNACHQIQNPLVQLANARHFFVKLLSVDNAIRLALPLMHKHHILSIYLPEWTHITGQMQFDLFHSYTVDEHTIRLLKHIHLFSLETTLKTHPICHQVYPTLKKKYCLIIAALFHDIGKGYHLDHSKLGSTLAIQFCETHQYNYHDTQLITWLVENHLLLSITAQKQDIYDEDVIIHFADQVQSIERLNYLICLTVADICATNQNIWNQWKRTLIGDLYQQTAIILQERFLVTERQLSIKEQIKYKQNNILNTLRSKNIDTERLQELWLSFKREYFIRYSISQIIWHSHGLLDLEKKGSNFIILIRNEITQGATELFIYCTDRLNLFAHIVTCLTLKRLNIHAAQILTTENGYAMDSFLLIDHKGEIIDTIFHQELVDSLAKTLQNQKINATLPQRAHHLLPFKIKPKVIFNKLRGRNKQYRTSIEVIALDVPGLLTTIANVFMTQGLILHSAKITTVGEKAEDTFLLSKDERALTLDEQQMLEDHLLLRLN